MTYAAQLFEPFKRLHRQHEFEGTGVGLATVHRVIERHGGRVRGEGVVGEGAAFYFSVAAPGR
jgi:light-regulated signal transduction histidine kinase (bacteriophytochrome)